ncbi:DUF1194 domain-containing protein [Mesorhizobium sp. LHD-90]|uniref:DUF1194 domain-containing protein n=1 Tax=Mesorhizobium sp. LHD-90 TaxID=3071414 RepID=UPI0027E03793|nr:DUF1194 domain-containing protein [Mesorhizobium sp. LHD-90]MDQ6436452.1 DUF1194 domain-containing protein [Mesorhizobium sp. LHD-90]
MSMLAFRAHAQEREPVDVELVLGADISASMTQDELKIQREGYATALTDPAVLNAIRSGAHGRIAVTYFEWAGVTSQSVMVPWTVIAGEEDAEAIARKIAVPPTWQSRRTSISGAMIFAAGLLETSPYKGIKRVIDLSGDGANNEGPPLPETRDDIVAQGITINGLPVMTADAAPQPYDVPNLDDYFSECVIGGPGAFVMPVHEWEQFPEAIRRKLLLELAIRPKDFGRRPPVTLIQAKPAYDCLIGEKLWRLDGRKHFFNPENDYRRRGTP